MPRQFSTTDGEVSTTDGGASTTNREASTTNEGTSISNMGTSTTDRGISTTDGGISITDGGVPAVVKQPQGAGGIWEDDAAVKGGADSSDIIIALMGPTGAGKSSFIAHATKQEDTGVGHDLTSCTSEIQVTKCDVEGFSIVLVDTPGFGHTNKSDLDILKLISEWLKAQYRTSQPTLSAILYFHRISDNRTAGTPLKNLRVFEMLCGKDAMSKVILVTTMWDEVDSEVGKERLKELKESYWKGMVLRGSTTFECEDARGSPVQLLRQIVQRKREQARMGEEEGNDYVTEGPTSSPCMRQSERIWGDDPVVIGGARIKDTIIALMGPTGAGKSSFIVNVTKQEGKDVGHDLTPYTSEIKATKCEVEGSNIVLVDTPGFDNTNISDLDILKLISDWLNAEYRTSRPVLSAILYFHRISDNRMVGTPLKNLRVFEKLCGRDAMSKVTLVTTMWDEVDSEVGKERLEELKESYWKAMVSQGSATFECEDARESPMKLLRQIVQQKKEQKLIGEDEDNVMLQEEILTKSWDYWKELLGSSCIVV
ncbi:P-loop containing nucleoside triphosphate hydrolase protein [Pisolithus croceorrhizus]|nr:P-loop containing nucleoside triphosphate hydrolase protein [Pisolithus croceorrhizus]